MAKKIKPNSNDKPPKPGTPSEEYWRERESRQRAENIRNEAKTAGKINEIFQRMQDAIQQEIESFYERYADAEGITIAEAKKRISRLDMEQYERLAKKYVKLAHAAGSTRDMAFTDEANAQMRLYNATMKINRLEMLKARCGIRTMEGYTEVQQLINDELEDRAYSEYSRLAGILGNSVQFNENMVRSIVNASYQNATWSQRLWTNQSSLSSMIGTQLAQGILAGKGSTVLAREIQKLTGGSTYACQRLMRTELRRVQTEAALQSMTDNGVTEYKFMVENGVNPCDECLALDGEVFKLSDMNVGKNAPPMHPQCVLPGTKIIAPGMEAIMRSEYSGDVVEIGTASGARLSVTPNHIVLTERGWIRAKNVVKGDKVIHYTGRGEHGVEVHPANDDCIPAVEELFTAFVKAGGVSAFGVPASPVDFKGDVVPQSKVDVVFINSQLRDEVDASVSKHGGYGPFIRALVIGERGLEAESPLNKALIWYGFAADGIMSRLSERGVFLGSPVRCTDLVRFRTTADYNARLLQVSTDNGSTDVVSIGKSIFTNSGLVISNDNLEDVGGQFNGGVRRNSELNSVLDQDALNCFGSFMDDVCNVTKVFAGIVQFDDVVDVTSRFYSGHVYDTSCMSTLYTANGIITSNCHCATAPYVDEAKWQRWLAGPAKEGVPWAEFEGKDGFLSNPKDERGRSIRYGKNNSFEQYGRTIHAKEVKTSGNSMYIDNSIQLTRKEVRDLDSMISKAKELQGVHYKCNAPFVITDNGGRIASYNPRTNTFFVDFRMANLEKVVEQQKGFAAPENVYSTVVHELFHWKDAEEYRETGNTIDRSDFKSAYSQHNRSIAKKELKNAGIDISNPSDIANISQYAYLKWLENDLEEVYTEYRTKELLKE